MEARRFRHDAVRAAGARRLRDRGRPVGRCRSTCRNPVLYYNKTIFAAPGSIRTPRRRRSRSSARTPRRSSTRASASASRSRAASTRGGGGSSSSGSPRPAALRRQQQRPRRRRPPGCSTTTRPGRASERSCSRWSLDGSPSTSATTRRQDELLKLADPADPADGDRHLGRTRHRAHVARRRPDPRAHRDDIGVGPMPGPGEPARARWSAAPRCTSSTTGDAEQRPRRGTTSSYLVSAESAVAWAARPGYVPVREDALDLEPLASTYAADPRFKVAYDQLVGRGDAPASSGPCSARCARSAPYGQRRRHHLQRRRRPAVAHRRRRPGRTP